MKSLKLSNLEIAGLCRELALLLHAGVALDDGLFLLAEEEREAQTKALMTALAGTVAEGSGLHAALERAGCFPAYAVGLVKVGEQVGRLEETLEALAAYYERQESMQRQIRSSLTYPAVLLLMMLVVIVILLVKVLPVFNDIYASLGGQLVGVAGGLLMLGQALRRALPLLCAVLTAVALAAAVVLLHKGLYEKFTAYWNAHGGDRGLFKKMNDLRFVQALAMGFRSGLPLEDAAGLALELVESAPSARARGEACRQRLQDGESLARALGETEIMSAAACRLLTLAMRSGAGDTVLEDIARQMAEDVQQELERKVSGIEPAMVLICSVLVGAILLSVMLPLMNIMAALG